MRPRCIMRNAAAIAAVLIAMTTSAAGQTNPIQPSPAAPEPMAPEPEALNVTPFLGLGMSGDLENAPATFGVALGYGLTSRVAVEGDLSFAPGAEQGVITEFDTSV